MRILQVNKFFYLKGGPERYIFNVVDLLRSKGHDIALFSMEHEKNTAGEWNKYFVGNIEYNKKLGLASQIKIFKNTLYSHEAKNKISQLIDNFKPDIAHLHNFNHQLTPSILFALKDKNVPIVMTMHDYKLVCPSYSMLNHGKPCELCRGGRFYHCLRTRCHKDSVSKSLLVALESYLHHQILNSYKSIDYFICPSRFIMHKAQEMGQKGNFAFIPNFVSDLNVDSTNSGKRNRFVCFGRMSVEKGLYTLLEAIKDLPLELDLIGDGPLRQDIGEKISHQGLSNVRMSGYLSGQNLIDKIKQSSIAVIPSQCYENNPISVMEAFTLGIPVIGARIGGIPELIIEGETGLLFNPGDAGDLREKMKYLIDNPEKAIHMGRVAREVVKKTYNTDLHYERLIKTYNDATKMH